MKPKKAKKYKTCDFCGRIGLLGYVLNPTPGWIYESPWACKNQAACQERVERNKRILEIL